MTHRLNHYNHFNMPKHLPSPFTIFSQQLLSILDSSFWAFNNTKFSYPELSHRSQHFAKVNQKAQDLVRSYYQVPENYHVLFFVNEAVFAAVPFNLNKFVNNSAIYVVNDAQSQFAYKQALKLNPKVLKIDHLSKRKQVVSTLSEKPYYFYTYYDKISLQSGEIEEEVEPLDGEILVCNLNYCAHYTKVDVGRHGIVFFDAGRGIGLTGSSVVIVRKDLVGFDLPTCPDLMSFQKTVTANSIINTPYTLSTLLLAEYIDYCNNNGKKLKNIETKIRKIKQEYVAALKEKTEVIETQSSGIIKFKAPNSLTQDQWKEWGWKFGDYMVIIIQEENEGKASDFANLIFSN